MFRVRFYIFLCAQLSQRLMLILFRSCIDSTKFTGTIAYTPVSVQGYWEIPMDGISLNGATVAGTSCSAAIDTGTSLSYFPVAVAAAFYAQLGGKSTGSTGEYVVPCSTMLSSVALSFSGVKYYINLNDLFIGCKYFHANELIDIG